MIPPMSCTHHTSISRRAEIALMMSNVPAKTRKKLITAASARNVSPGWMNETIPVAMKITARIPYSNLAERQPPLAEVALAACALTELRHGQQAVGVDTLKRLVRE